MSARVAVIGATSWGTTLAVLFARADNDVSLITRNVAEADAIDVARENTRHRPGLSLPINLRVSADPEAVATASLVVLAVPSSSLRANLTRFAPAFAADATVLSAVKGVEAASGLRMSEVIAAFGVEAARIAALSGPNFASEIAAGLPAASVVACADHGRAVDLQSLLSGPAFRIYTSSDVTGVELGGALKNVVAIACGISDGLGYGENAKAALITRALAEVTRLGVASGAQAMTFLGLAGMGDLILTCESNLSRNRRLGLAMAKGMSLPEATDAVDGVVEGAETARSIPALVQRSGVEMPICESLRAVLYESKSPQQAVQELMARAARPELDDQ